MPSTEHEGLATYIDELVAATKEGKISWTAVNPTTFVWETSVPKNAKVSLQRIERSMFVPFQGKTKFQRRTTYLFTVVDLDKPSTPILSVEGIADATIDEKLGALFDLVKSGITEKTMKFLKSILPE